MPGRHSAKERRQARHVIDSERKRGVSEEEAKRIGWSTVNKQRKMKMKKDMQEYAPGASIITAPPPPPPPPPPTSKSAKSKLKKELPSGEAYPAMGKADDSSSPMAAAPVMRRRPEKPTIKMKPISNAEAAANLRAGKFYEKSFKILTVTEMADELGRRQVEPHLLLKADLPAPPSHWKPSWHPPAMTSHYAVHGELANPKQKYKSKQRARRAADKLDLKHGRVSHQVYAVPHEGETKKAITVGSKPTTGSVQGASHYVVHGTHEAGHTGYATFGMAQKRADRLNDKHGSRSHAVHVVMPDAQKAVPPPIPAAAKRESLHHVQAQLNTATSVAGRKPAKTYLPGVHDPKDPARRTTGLRKPKMKAFPTIIASETAADKLQKPGTTASLMSSVRDSDLRKKRKVAKSEKIAHNSTITARTFQGDPMNINDLFKAELEAGVDGSDKVLIECPHCDAPITKSQVIAKARGAGKEAHIEGEGSKATADAHVAHQNGKDGGATRTKGKSVLDPSRTGEGAMAAGHPVGEKRAADKVVGVQNSKGSEAHKAMAESSSDEESTAKSQKSGPIVRGSAWVQYIDNGEDAFIAKSIAEGTLGEQPTQPLDKNNRRT